MTDTAVKSELEVLKEQADTMGIKYPKNISTDKLKKLLERGSSSDDDEPEEDENQKRINLERENMRLVNVIITPTNPHKTGFSSGTFSTGNSVLGTITRVVPFGKPTLIENMLLKHIRELEYQFMYPVKDTLNPSQEIIESRLVKAYSIQELPLPTQKEIDELAKAQKARQSVDVE